jgi:uncharacterized lipoprotein YmbA
MSNYVDTDRLREWAGEIGGAVAKCLAAGMGEEDSAWIFVEQSRDAWRLALAADEIDQLRARGVPASEVPA